MNRQGLTFDDRLGLLMPALDAHTLGPAGLSALLADCGMACPVAPDEVRRVLGSLDAPASVEVLRSWILSERLTALGLSYRLDPETGVALLTSLLEILRRTGLLEESGGPLRLVYFGGLPRACELARQATSRVAGYFRGGEDGLATFDILGLPRSALPPSLLTESAYDRSRRAFAEELIKTGDHLGVPPPERGGYRLFGQKGDSVTARIAHYRAKGTGPVLRAHAGPYLPDRKEAVTLFLDWASRLAAGGQLDVLSIGSSQLSQSEFGRPWEGLPNGGGVPLATPDEFERVWKAARPLLVRSYSGTRDVPAMARLLDETIDNAWHALSLWWFSRLDGRGPQGVLENLSQHLETISYVARVGRPFEPNVPHHFAFRGGDDLTYVLSGYLAAKAAKARGVTTLILQVMLNTPRGTSGLADLAKARALLHLVRELEDGDFKVILQARGGLDHFSADPWLARIQLASVTALMDDIEPFDSFSPQIIHVVSFSEGTELASPDIIDESAQITRHALAEYRRRKSSGLGMPIGENSTLIARTAELLREARAAVASMESLIPDTYSALGLYTALAAGYLLAPGLQSCQEEFPKAMSMQTRLMSGSVRAVGEDGLPLSMAERIGRPSEAARRLVAARRGRP